MFRYLVRPQEADERIDFPNVLIVVSRQSGTDFLLYLLLSISPSALFVDIQSILPERADILCGLDLTGIEDDDMIGHHATVGNVFQYQSVESLPFGVLCLQIGEVALSSFVDGFSRFGTNSPSGPVIALHINDFGVFDF